MERAIGKVIGRLRRVAPAEIDTKSCNGLREKSTEVIVEQSIRQLKHYTFSIPVSITVKAYSKRENQVQYAYYQFEKLSFSYESNEFILKYSMSEFKSNDFILEERHLFSRANRSF